MNKIKKNQRVTIREMGTVERGLLGKRDKNNPQLKLTFSMIKNNLWIRRKSALISVKHAIYIELKKRTPFLTNMIKTISDVLKDEEFKGLNGIVGKHRDKKIIILGFQSNSKRGI